MKFREYPEPAEGWLNSTIVTQIRQYGQQPWVDRKRVTEAMHYGWRYTEDEGVPQDRYLGALQTSAWFNIDAVALGGVMLGSDPAVDELPPLPFARIAIDATDGDSGKRAPLFGITLRRESANKHDSSPKSSHMYLDDVLMVHDEVEDDEDSITLGVASMVLFEIEQGRLWDCMITLVYLNSKVGVKHELMGYHLKYNGHTADYAAWKKYKVWGWDVDEEEADDLTKFDSQIGHLVWKSAVSVAHMITATNVRNVRVLPKRKQMREWGRSRFGPVEPRIYRVDIMSTNAVRTSGVGDREYHCRWMVRGHYRRTAHGEFKHPQDGTPASWVRAHIKGPAGAPWKGRPYHVREAEIA